MEKTLHVLLQILLYHSFDISMNCPSQNLLKTPVCWGVCFVWVSQAQTLLSATPQGCANNMPDPAL